VCICWCDKYFYGHWIVLTRCVLTPNHAEFGRLITALQSRIGDSLDAEYLARELASGVIWRQVRAASQALGGVTVVCKGAEDVISAGDDVYILNEQGSPRRCGGQGDILSGSLAVALTWALKVLVVWVHISRS
jgi:ATP-dependent NAD(P)H-hydrate dehydratase